MGYPVYNSAKMQPNVQLDIKKEKRNAWWASYNVIDTLKGQVVRCRQRTTVAYHNEKQQL